MSGENAVQVNPLSMKIDLIVCNIGLLSVLFLKNESFYHFLGTYNRVEHNILIFLFWPRNPKYLIFMILVFVENCLILFSGSERIFVDDKYFENDE